MNFPNAQSNERPVFYWYPLYPIHGMIFGGMIQKLAKRAKDIATEPHTDEHYSRA